MNTGFERKNNGHKGPKGVLKGLEQREEGLKRREEGLKQRKEINELSPSKEHKKFLAVFYKHLHMEMVGPHQYTVEEIDSFDLEDVILPKNCEKFELIEVTVIEEKINGQDRETGTKIGKRELYYIAKYLGERSMGFGKVTCAKTPSGVEIDVYPDESDNVYLIDPSAVKDGRIYPKAEFDNARDDEFDDPFSL